MAEMDMKEKLVELLDDIQRCGEGYTDHEIYGMRLPDTVSNEDVADPLIANGVTVQEWISVKDRLPEESGMYIVAANDGHAQRVSFVLWQKRNKAWNLTGARSYWRVTHWRPMPQPPKGE